MTMAQGNSPWDTVDRLAAENKALRKLVRAYSKGTSYEDAVATLSKRHRRALIASGTAWLIKGIP